MIEKKIILIPDRISVPDIEKKVFGDEFEIITASALNVKDIDDNIWESANAILAWHDLTYDADLINKLTSCKVIVRVGVGYDNVDLNAARKKNIIVCNVPDYGTNDVADHTMALLLCIVRGIHTYNNRLKNENIWNSDAAGELLRLTGAKIGIVGLGRIGTAVALRGKAFGMDVYFYDPFIPVGQEKALQIKRVNNLHALVKCSDIVSIHTPLTIETRSMINEEFFKNMKHTAILINTARGKIIEIDALYHALLNNTIKAVGLDVLPKEPPDKNHPLILAWQNDEDWISDRLLITPHSAFYTRESFIEMRQKAAKEALRIFNGDSPMNQVNKY